MIISSEQVRLARHYLQTPSSTCDAVLRCDLNPEILQRVHQALSVLPDCRDDRVDEARDRLSVALPSSAEIADKMIGRIISDSLR